MAAYTSAFIAGAYSITYDSQLMGYTEVGFEEIKRPSANIIRLDPTGRTPIDALWTGVEDIVIRIESMEWSANIWSKAINFIKSGGTTEGIAEKAGQLLVAGGLAKALVIAPVTDTSQAAYGYKYCYPLEPVRTIFSAQRLRTTPAGFFVFAKAFDSTTLLPTMYTVGTGAALPTP